jgi:chromosome segregation ATPase
MSDESLDTLLINLKQNGDILNTKVQNLITNQSNYKSKIVNDLTELNKLINDLDLRNYVNNKKLFSQQQQELQNKTLELKSSYAENLRLKGEIENKTALINEQTRKITETNTQLSQKISEVNGIKGKISSLENNNSALMAKNREYESKMKDLGVQIENYKQQLLELNGLKQTRNTLIQEKEILNNKIKELQTLFEAEKQKSNDCNQKISQNEERFRQVTTDLEASKLELQKINEASTELKNQHGILQQERDVIKSNISSLEQEQERIKQALRAINDNIMQQIRNIDTQLSLGADDSSKDDVIELLRTIKSNLSIGVNELNPSKGGKRRRYKSMNKHKAVSNQKSMRKQRQKSKKGGWTYRGDDALDSQSQEITSNSNSNSSVRGKGIRQTKKNKHKKYSNERTRARATARTRSKGYKMK